MIESPLVMKTVFTIGPVPITEPVVTTWGLIAALTLVGFFATRSLKLSPTRSQAALELIFGAIADQIRGTMRAAPTPYVPLIGTLFSSSWRPIGRRSFRASSRRRRISKPTPRSV